MCGGLYFYGDIKMDQIRKDYANVGLIQNKHFFNGSTPDWKIEMELKNETNEDLLSFARSIRFETFHEASNSRYALDLGLPRGNKNRQWAEEARHELDDFIAKYGEKK
tara:strand:- start:1162 stop:1485 length:324 start_codon:yes stop_codon:yes gene_type:complete